MFWHKAWLRDVEQKAHDKWYALYNEHEDKSRQAHAPNRSRLQANIEQRMIDRSMRTQTMPTGDQGQHQPSTKAKP